MEAPPLNLRQARVELKITTEMKKLLSERAGITLAKQGQAALVQLLHAPKRPTKSMKNLMALPDLTVLR